jgi:hypothetical protein
MTARELGGLIKYSEVWERAQDTGCLNHERRVRARCEVGKGSCDRLNNADQTALTETSMLSCLNCGDVR